MNQNADNSPNKDEQPVFFRGPANWFSLTVPAELNLQQTEAFLELKPKQAAAKKATTSGSGNESITVSPWSLTLYAAWVDEDEPETRAASFDPTSLFPNVVHSRRQSSLPLDADSRVWSGVSRNRSVNWWTALFQRVRTYEWRLWVIEYDAIIVVASLQSATGKALSGETVSTCENTLSSIQFAETLAKPPELFRRDVLALAQKHFPLLESEPVGVFAVKIAESEVNLANFYRSYIQEPHRLKQIVLPGLATVVRLQEWGPDQLMPPLDEVSERVMPMLYSDIDADASLDGFVRMPWVGGLSVMFVLDEDDTYRFVHEKMLDRWEITPDELHVLAMDNLNEFSRDNPLEVTLIGEDDDPRMLVPVEPNAYNSVRLLGSQLHRRLRELLGSELIVGLPNRDFFVAVSLGHPRLVGQVRERVIQDYQSMHHPLTSRLLVISADGVSEYCES